jgi:hypothetical protein
MIGVITQDDVTQRGLQHGGQSVKKFSTLSLIRGLGAIRKDSSLGSA